MEQAASVGVTFVAAWIGLVEYSHIKPDQALIVIGVTGGVGMAAAQIAKSRGARVIGIARRQLPANFHRCTTIDKFLLLEDGPLDEMIRTPIHDLLADVVFDTVGGAMFERALRLLGHQGTLIEIASTGSRRVSFDLIDFYHNESRLLGVDTRTRDALASAKLLEAISPLFDARILRAGSSEEVISLTDGPAAYGKVTRGEVCGRVTLAP